MFFIYFFHQFWEVFAIVSSNTLSVPFPVFNGIFIMYVWHA